MSKFLKVTDIAEITPSGLDGHLFRLSFEIGEKEGDKFVAESSHKVDVEGSRTLQAVWKQSDEDFQTSSTSTATVGIMTLVNENRLEDLPRTFRVNTYSAPKEPPKTPILEVGALTPISEFARPEAVNKYSILSDDISEVRDQINTLTREIWDGRILLLAQERPLLDMYKPVRNAEEFRGRIQSLGIIVKDVDKTVLANVTGEANPENVGEIVLLERALATLGSPEKSGDACNVLKAINDLRQGYPTHGDHAKKVLPAHRFFGLPYPVDDFEAEWEVILGRYFGAMRDIRELLSAVWARKRA